MVVRGFITAPKLNPPISCIINRKLTMRKWINYLPKSRQVFRYFLIQDCEDHLPVHMGYTKIETNKAMNPPARILVTLFCAMSNMSEFLKLDTDTKQNVNINTSNP